MSRPGRKKDSSYVQMKKTTAVNKVAPPKPRPTRRARLTGWRLWTMRVAAATLIPLLLLLLLEVVLRIANSGYSTRFLVSDEVRGEKVYTENSRFTWQFFPRDI